MNKKFLIKQIDSHKYVSFDIFDTLIKRNIKEPTDIFELSNIILKNRVGVEIENFKQIRIDAEKKARMLSKGEEVTFDEIYSQINGIDNEIKRRIYDIELECEYNLCQSNEEIKCIYDYCIEKNKNIIIISDMYLKKEFIEKLLYKCGFDGYKKLYVSSEYNMTKHTGSVYRYVLNDMSINANEVFHIGDNFKSDFLRAKQNGMNSYLYRKKTVNINNKIKYKDINDNIVNNILSTFNYNNYPTKKSNEFIFGYEKVAPLVLGFVYWLKSNLNSRNIDKVYFLSREGLFLKKCLECLCPEFKEKSKYLYVSRRSLQVPFLKDINSFDDIMSILEFRKKATIEVFLSKCGMDNKEIQYWCKIKKCSLKTKLEDIKEPNLFFKDVIESIKENSKCEFDLLIQYLKQEKFNGKVAIVDIGWKGTMQKLLKRNLDNGNIKADIRGFYMGLLNNKENSIDTCKHGYLENVDDVLYAGMTLFETMFFANHGSVKKYNKIDNLIKPILCENEYTSADIIKLSQIQEGIIHYLNTYKINIETTINSNVAFSRFSRVLENPTLNEVKLLGGISYFDTQRSSLAKVKYTLNLKKAVDDFLLSGWKVGYLKLFFKINMPYMKIYKLMKEKI